jgi:murein DD-endopeptidase MepM/ murein hydrolase activator NlpD
MAAGLSEQDLERVRQMFASARRDVEVAVFRKPVLTQAGQDFLALIRQAEEAAAGRLRVREREYREGETLVERAPAVALFGPQGEDLRIRFYGWPLGYEFGTLLATAADAAGGGGALAPETLTALGNLRQTVQIKVFTTPT